MVRAAALGLAFLLGASSTEAAPAITVGNWTVDKLVDPMTDAARANTFAKGDGGRIGVKCDTAGPSSIYVEVISDTFLGADGTRKLTVRLDQEVPQDVSWYYSGETIVLVNNAEAMIFARRLQKAHRLALRLISYKDEQIDVVIPLDGAEGAIQAIVDACGQK